MIGWKMIFEDEVEHRLVTVKVYESRQDEDGDEGLAMRVIVAAADDDEEGQAAGAEAQGADSLITLEPSTLEDLEEELIEIGFTPEAAAWIADQVAT